MGQVTQESLMKMLSAMESEDGNVHKENFKVVYLKLHPETTNTEYDKLWLKIDEDGDGNLDIQELAHFFGVNYHKLAKDMEDHKKHEAELEEMDDDQILEALQMEQALRELQASTSRDSSPALPEKKARARMGSRDEDVEVFKVPTKITNTDVKPEIELLMACECQDEAEILDLIENKQVNVRIEDDKGEMPLHKIARFGSIKCTRAVLKRSDEIKKGSKARDLNMGDRKGKTPLMIAVEYKHQELMTHLLDSGANLKTQQENGWTIMHTVVNTNDKKLVQNFLIHSHVEKDKKQLLNSQDNNSRNPMHIASFKCDEDIVEILVKSGASTTATDNSGITPMDLAQRAGRRKSREIMEGIQGLTTAA